jgi:hypothetical protein
MERDEIVRKKLIKKSIKCRNRVIKSRGTKPVEKIKLNKISRDKIKKKNPNFKRVQKPNKQ